MEVEPATSWSPVGRASNWVTKASTNFIACHRKIVLLKRLIWEQLCTRVQYLTQDDRWWQNVIDYSVAVNKRCSSNLINWPKHTYINYCILPNYCTYSYKRTVKQFHNLQITASVLFVYFFIKAYVVGTHLNCIDLMQFKWVPTTYAFIKKIRKKKNIA